MISIFTDTFNDYWQRYWNHKDAWNGNNYPGELKSIQIGITISILFYLRLIIEMFREKNNLLRKLGAFWINWFISINN